MTEMIEYIFFVIRAEKKKKNLEKEVNSYKRFMKPPPSPPSHKKRAKDRVEKEKEKEIWAGVEMGKIWGRKLSCKICDAIRR